MLAMVQEGSRGEGHLIALHCRLSLAVNDALGVTEGI